MDVAWELIHARQTTVNDAARHGDLETVKHLVQEGASINVYEVYEFMLLWFINNSCRMVIRATEVWFGVSRSQTALMPDDHQFETRKQNETRKILKIYFAPLF